MSRRMRTTLTLDDDVAAELERLRRTGDASLKDLVNDALRRGLRQLGVAKKSCKQPFTRPVDAGECLIGNIDCIGEIMGMLDDEKYR